MSCVGFSVASDDDGLSSMAASMSGSSSGSSTSASAGGAPTAARQTRPPHLGLPGGLALGDQGVGDLLDERPGICGRGRGPQLLRLASPAGSAAAEEARACPLVGAGQVFHAALPFFAMRS